MVITIPYKWTLSKIQNLAKKRRGRCLSTVYSNPRKKMLWECENGHVWEAVFDSIRRGSWCLQCRKNRPLTIEDIRETAEKRGGICLSEKYVNSSTKLKWQCSDEHIWYATPNNIRQGAWCPKCGAKKTNANKRLTIEMMNNLAKKRGGRCLSKEYIGIDTKLKWQCSKGHVWETAPTNIQSGGWCPECAKVKRKTIDDAIKLAQSRHGKFLSKRFKSVHNKYWWQCSKGHIWRTTYSSISAGTWCRFCSKKKYLDIAEMQKIAKSHGGKCLSKRYINSNTPLTFQCGKGHIWKTKPQYITAGHWCHVCAGSRRGASQRLTIELMQRIAKKRGGKCLSKVYKNARTKLRWECAEGHVWQSVPYIVKKRSWCPICAVKNRTELKVCPK